MLQPVGGSAFLLYTQLDARPVSFPEELRKWQCIQRLRLGHLLGPAQLLLGQRNHVTGQSLLRTVLSLINM